MKNWQLSICAGLAVAGTASAGLAFADQATDTTTPPAAAPATPASTGAPAAAAPAAPASNAMSTPAMSVTLSANPNPYSINAGPLGKIYVTGAITGYGEVQNNPVPGDHKSWADISAAQLFIQKTDGVFQFYVQVGPYSLPSLGVPNVRSTTYDDETYGYVPNAFIKFAPSSSFNIIAGKLPTLLGDETTFTFQNVNIERGLLWNQENVVNRGVQANYTKGPITMSVAISDGFYSNRFTWITGLLTYTLTPQDSVTFAGGGNFDKTTHNTFVSPLLYNNSSIYNIILTHTQGPFMISPYFQYTSVGANPAIGITHGASTTSAAILTKYSFTPAFSVAARGEVITSTGGNVTSLLYGPGSQAFSLTLTPTYQFKIFFLRGEVSYVKAQDITAGFGFGPSGANTSQVRGMLETGVLF
jgi:hypothetical protein